MKVLVTGGCGFVGSHTCEYYIKKGDEVVAFDNMTEYELKRTGYNSRVAREHNWKFLEDLGVRMVKGDVCNLPEILEAAKGCDYIVHTAAQPAMTIAIEEPELDLRTNVLGTFNVLEAARRYDIPVVNCSTIHVYGNKINENLREEETRYTCDPPSIDENYPIMQGTITPLHASKRSGELYVQCYIDTYNLEAATFRLTGMYGPRQFGGVDHGWVANFVIRTVMELPITIFGTGKQVRDILYASDVAKAFDAFYRRKKPGLYTIGGGIDHAISLIECLDLIKEITGKEQTIVYENSRLGDLAYFVCDITKAKHELNWEPTVSNREGIERLVEWVEENKEIFRG
ncbi:MAG: nucleoside-diphosphate sugar epimerase [Candidatus Syntrophoarchaeum butanivorans]|uniref:Nucleoside-diphosphate sugar epimerase n=1 Tax=Candidatus Syntropharchaeum butanivorans TaxID=1839936 RepID=A0A1F2P7U6_9EURY|nr:MAG: nucleoside-diphosphate sugar epimerase [Candidatus Syntrophoarchaeum butanivorans]